jgi:hypothetical protein
MDDHSLIARSPLGQNIDSGFVAQLQRFSPSEIGAHSIVPDDEIGPEARNTARNDLPRKHRRG